MTECCQGDRRSFWPSSCEGDRGFAENLLEGIRRVGESDRAGEAERLLGNDQVWLQHAKALVAVGNSIGKQPGDLTVTGSGRDVAVGLRIEVLYVEVFYMRAEARPRVVNRLPGFEIVGRVEGMDQEEGAIGVSSYCR